MKLIDKLLIIINLFLAINLLISFVVFKENTSNHIINHSQTTEEKIQLISEAVSSHEEIMQECKNDLKVIADKLENVQTENKYKGDTYTLINILNKTDKWSVNEEVALPDIPTNMKFCTDYRCYNIDGTPHKRLQSVSYTDELGCRRYNDDYCVGLGSFYSERIGDRFEVTLDTGNIFTIITGDMKADCDTDINNMYTPCINYESENCANVLEFIIDDDVVSEKMYAYGSLDYHDEFKGNIIKMVYLGRDTSMDWDVYE